MKIVSGYAVMGAFSKAVFIWMNIMKLSVVFEIARIVLLISQNSGKRYRGECRNETNLATFKKCCN